jgi:rubrerythrin
MNINFNADEIFEIAEQIERNGAKFYHKAAKNNLYNSAKKQLTALANMEEQHEKTFAKMREQLILPEWKSPAVEPTPETALYLQAFAGNRVFNLRSNPVDSLKGDESLEEILKIAIKLEEDSIVFYLGMKEIVPPILGKDKLDHIIKEEQNHIGILYTELLKLK